MRHKKIHSTLPFLFLFGWLAAPAQSTSLPEQGACNHAMPVPLNDTGLMSGIASTESDLFALDVPAPGILGLEVSAQSSDSTGPALFFLGRTCVSMDHAVPLRDTGAFVSIDQSSRGHLIEVRVPGTYFMRVLAVDPLRELESYKLSSRFVEGAWQWSAALNKNDDDIDIDEWDEEILSLTASSPEDPVEAWLEARFRAFCGQERGADPGDFTWCATPVAPGKVARGELFSPWGEDVDYFTFTLDRTRVLSIEGASSASTLLSLYDLLGNRLGLSSHHRQGDSFGILRVLSAGRYMLRVEGLYGSAGSYQVVVRPEVGRID